MMAEARQPLGDTTRIGSLLERIQAGDGAARDELIEEAQERLRQMVSKKLSRFPSLRERGRAETGMVLNDVLERMYKSFDDVKVNFQSPGMFFGIAATKIRRCLIDLKRKHEHEIRLMSDLKLRHEQAVERKQLPDNWKVGLEKDKMGAMLPTAGGAVQGTGDVSLDDWTAFHESVDHLPEEEKEVFTLRYYGGWSREETAKIIGVAEKTVTRRYGRAMSLLADTLGPQC